MSTLRFTIVLLVMFFGNGAKNEAVNESARGNNEELHSTSAGDYSVNKSCYAFPGGNKAVSSRDLNFADSGRDDLYVEYETSSFYTIKTKYGRLVCNK